MHPKKNLPHYHAYLANFIIESVYHQVADSLWALRVGKVGGIFWCRPSAIELNYKETEHGLLLSRLSLITKKDALIIINTLFEKSTFCPKSCKRKKNLQINFFEFLRQNPNDFLEFYILKYEWKVWIFMSNHFDGKNHKLKKAVLVILRAKIPEYWNAALRGAPLRSGVPRSRSAVGAQLRKLPRSASRSATPKKAGALAGARAPTIMPNKIKKWILSR